jgi:hypothetical protein
MGFGKGLQEGSQSFNGVHKASTSLPDLAGYNQLYAIKSVAAGARITWAKAGFLFSSTDCVPVRVNTQARRATQP